MRKYNYPEEIGNKYGYLTVLQFHGRNLNYPDGYVCRCACGKEEIRSLYRLKVGHTKTCGCGINKYTIYKDYPEEYSVFLSMFKRAKYFNETSHRSYFDKGISISESWGSNYFDGFTNFLEDMGPRPSKDHELDRVDNNGDYCKENCRWVHRAVNALNKDNTVLLTLGEHKIPLRFLVSLFSLKWATVRDRLVAKLPLTLVFYNGDLKSNQRYKELKSKGFVFKKFKVPELTDDCLTDSDPSKEFEKKYLDFILEEFGKFENK